MPVRQQSPGSPPTGLPVTVLVRGMVAHIAPRTTIFEHMLTWRAKLLPLRSELLLATTMLR
jgi:hypothetical protein